MKTQIKLAFLICTTVLTHALSAQTHKKAASNCIMYDDYVKAASKTKNAVSCIDCYCKICGDKKQKEKEAKLKAAEAANKQKTSTPQKKTTATTTTKAKSNEAILVAPKPKTNKTTAIVLSADDKKIIEIGKNIVNGESFLVGYCLSDGMDYMMCSEYPDLKNSGKIIFKPKGSNDNQHTVLKDNFIIKSKHKYTGFAGGFFYEAKEFIEGFKYAELFTLRLDDSSTNFEWFDLVDVQGNCVFNNKDIVSIEFSDKNKAFLIKKDRNKGFTEQYDPITKETTPIN